MGNYVEPFAGSLAVLLARPHQPRLETVNDKDCYLANFWRALKEDPAGVTAAADWPVNEADLHARHKWLVARADFREQMKTDPAFFDAKIAGWWVWGICQWIGSGWCSRADWTGRGNGSPRGIHASTWKVRPNLTWHGKGVHQKRPNLSGWSMPGVHKHAVGDRRSWLEFWLHELSERLRSVRVCCGDWQRILTPAVTFKVPHVSACAVLLDPPYSHSTGRDAQIYTEDSGKLSKQVRRWAIRNGKHPNLRIALCGYEGEHEMPDTWECVAWKANTGGHGKRNAHRERIWFSPTCLKPKPSGQGEFTFDKALRIFRRG